MLLATLQFVSAQELDKATRMEIVSFSLRNHMEQQDAPVVAVWTQSHTLVWLTKAELVEHQEGALLVILLDIKKVYAEAERRDLPKEIRPFGTILFYKQDYFYIDDITLEDDFKLHITASTF